AETTKRSPDAVMNTMVPDARSKERRPPARAGRAPSSLWSLEPLRSAATSRVATPSATRQAGPSGAESVSAAEASGAALAAAVGSDASTLELVSSLPAGPGGVEPAPVGSGDSLAESPASAAPAGPGAGTMPAPSPDVSADPPLGVS